MLGLASHANIDPAYMFFRMRTIELQAAHPPDSSDRQRLIGSLLLL